MELAELQKLGDELNEKFEQFQQTIDFKLDSVRQEYNVELQVFRKRMKFLNTVLAEKGSIKAISFLLLEDISTELGILPGFIRGRSKRREYADARHIWRYCLFQYKFTFVEIGKSMKCDHSTVMNSIEIVEYTLMKEERYKVLIDRLNPFK